MTGLPASNVDLCALMDGECGPQERARIEAAIAVSPQSAERLALWKRNDAALRAAVIGGAGAMARETAAPALDLAPPQRIDPGEPLRESLLRNHKALRRNIQAMVTAAFIAGAGAGAMGGAVLLMAMK